MIKENIMPGKKPGICGFSGNKGVKQRLFAEKKPPRLFAKCALSSAAVVTLIATIS
jgi:hypothetical protein